METSVFERIRGGLQEKRQVLTDFLQETPVVKKQVRLGTVNESEVQEQLQVIDAALEKTEDRTLGVCEVCHGYVESGLLEMDYTACVCLDHLSDIEKRQLESELELSQVVYKAMLPQQLPMIPGADLAVFSQPAQILGGDYFDFFQFRDGSHGFAIADIAGHGVSASILLASMQTALRTWIPESNSPAEVIERLNNFFLHNIHFTTFVTLFLGRFDPATHLLTYSNAGHNPPLLLRKAPGDNEPAWLRPTGPSVGLVEEFHVTEQAIKLSSGDCLLVYTDGVTEATNERFEEFGMQGLAANILEAADLPARDMIQSLRRSLNTFTNAQPLADDTTMLAFKIVA
jgi:sigma-B regulation protein RsbU (phosphoserine phosphatase)